MTDPDDFDFAYRTYYTWDHSTDWDLMQPGARMGGCHESYDKPPDAFIEDYARLIDFMSSVGFNHLIIWGALRDSHGGVDSLRRLIDYGLGRDVRVAPGVGINCYGGAYYEGDHEFSLVELLHKHPELAALDGDGQPMLGGDNPRECIACPRNPAVIDWTGRSLDWLVATVAPPAIHFEMGDYGVCNCRLCRDAGDRHQEMSADDMAEILPRAVARLRQSDKDCLLSYNYYYGYTRRMSLEPPAFITNTPDDVICKWGVSWMLAPELVPDWAPTADVEEMTRGVCPPAAINMGHLHFASGWWGCSPRGTLEISRIMRAMPLMKTVGFSGVAFHAEDNPVNPACELNYHVLAELARNADASAAHLADGPIGELYGDRKLAAEILRAFQEQRVARGLPPAVARAAARADGQRRVRLVFICYELLRLAERTRRD